MSILNVMELLMPKRQSQTSSLITSKPKSPKAIEVGQRIRERRELLGIRPEEVAAALGLTLTGYNHKETGRAETNSTQLQMIAGFLQTTVSYLFGEEPIDLSQNDRDVIRFLHGMSPPLREGAEATIKAMHDANAREETTHGKKAD